MLLIEREAETAALRKALSFSELVCETSVVLIEGPSGCGKSELLQAGLAWATAEGAWVLEAAGALLERRLPVGIMRQLLSGPAVPGDAVCRLRALLDTVNECPKTANDRFHAEDPCWPQTMHDVFVALGELSVMRPIVVAVDDLHYADDVSVQFLKYLVRRSRSARLSFIFTTSVHHQPRDQLFEAELLRHPAFQRLSVGRLSRDGVRCFAGQHARALEGSGQADEMYELSGGNPLLLRAVLDERGVEPSQEQSFREWRPRRDGPFRQAALACLTASGQDLVEMASGMAVLGADASVHRLGRLLGIGPDAAEWLVVGLRTAGLVVGTTLRHSAIRAAVLGCLTEAERTRLHERAAELLRDEGEPAAPIADHLVNCGTVKHPWGLQALAEAAETALLDDRARAAMAYLELALRQSKDAVQRAELHVRLAEIAGRVHPSYVEPQLDQVLAGDGLGRLPVLTLERLARMVRMRGYVAEGAAVVGRLREASKISEIVDSCSGSRCYPERRGVARTEVPRDPRRAMELDQIEQMYRVGLAHPGAQPALLATTVLWTLPGRPGVDTSAISVKSTGAFAAGLNDLRLPGTLNGIKALAFEDRTHEAVRWCETLLEEAEWRGLEGWHASVSAVLAEVLLLQGRLAQAEARAAQALDGVLTGADTVFAVGPVACQVLACTATGRYAEAARHLGRHFPERIFRSIDGLGYLRSRGQYYLATGNLQAALDDFLRMGRLAAAWGMDRPGLIAWRIDAAEALLRLGEKDEADRLITEQAAALDVSNARTRGMILRLRASSAELPMRRCLLPRAVAELQKSGDALQLARALADLGRTHKELGERELGESMMQRAWRMADECGAVELCEELRPGHATVFDGEVDAASTLSDSERRVASLATFGYTNREIAMELHVTVSTVEQHLTRVYRKLEVTRRQDLLGRC